MKSSVKNQVQVEAINANNLNEAVNTTNVELTKREIYRQKMNDAKQARLELREAVAEDLGVKTITRKDGTIKEVKPSKTYINQKATIAELSDLDNRTMSETQRLINAVSKIDDSNVSQLYKYVKQLLNGTLDSDKNGELNALAIELQGSNSVPTFNTFREALPVKFAYSKADAFKVLASFNKAKQREDRVLKQNKKTAQK